MQDNGQLSKGISHLPIKESPSIVSGTSIRLQSSKNLVRGFVPPDYLVDGILQRQFLYTLTGQTGAGKTAISLLLAAHVALGRSIGKIGIAQGKVVILAGENPTDTTMRWIAMSQELGFDVDQIPVYFGAGAFQVSKSNEDLRRQIEALGGVSLVIVDTSAAFFEGDDENNNRQAIDHAKMLRDLTELPGGPTILVPCHPTKAGTSLLSARRWRIPGGSRRQSDLQQKGRHR
jgi:RecA-family ATPase